MNTLQLRLTAFAFSVQRYLCSCNVNALYLALFASSLYCTQKICMRKWLQCVCGDRAHWLKHGLLQLKWNVCYSREIIWLCRMLVYALKFVFNDTYLETFSSRIGAHMQF